MKSPRWFPQPAGWTYWKHAWARWKRPSDPYAAAHSGYVPGIAQLTHGRCRLRWILTTKGNAPWPQQQRYGSCTRTGRKKTTNQSTDGTKTSAAKPCGRFGCTTRLHGRITAGVATRTRSTHTTAQ